MIEIRDLQKRFGGVTAVDGISFRAENGAITGILGENGAGKTTTLGMICGLLAPDSGSIRIDGIAGSSQEVRRRIGAVLDHQGLYPRLTARENIAYFGELQGLSGNVLDRQVEHMVGLLGLDRIAEGRSAGFSQGERLKVALGRAIVWVFLAIAWTIALILDGARGAWQPASATTAAFLDFSILSCRARRQAITASAVLYAALLAFMLAWKFQESAGSVPLDMWAYLTSSRVVVLWGITAGLGVLAVRRRRSLERELRNLLTLRRQLEQSGSPIAGALRQ